jgi:hypothetical protein
LRGSGKYAGNKKTFQVATFGRGLTKTNYCRSIIRRKNAYLKKNGWKVLRFTGKRIYRDLNGIIKRIEKEKGG